MTDAGWTSEKPTEAGWYWYQGDTDLDAVVVWVAPNMHLINLSHRGPVRAFDGKWLGPITPDSYQQGRVAGLRDAEVIAQFMVMATPSNVAAALRFMADKLEAQQAQEGGVGDGKV